MRLLRPWVFPGKHTEVGCHFLLQEIFLTQGLNPGLPHCRQTLYHLNHQRSWFLKPLFLNLYKWNHIIFILCACLISIIIIAFSFSLSYYFMSLPQFLNFSTIDRHGLFSIFFFVLLLWVMHLCMYLNEDKHAGEVKKGCEAKCAGITFDC